MKKTLLTILLIIWLIIIFLFSNQSAIVSQGVSDKATLNLINTTNSITNKPITNQEKQELIEKTRTIIRKTAHFSLYFILGIITLVTAKSYNLKKPILYSIIFCLLYACSDEIHQLFLDGRTPKIMDIIIDTMGSSLSIIVISNLKIKGTKHMFCKNERNVV